MKRNFFIVLFITAILFFVQSCSDGLFCENGDGPIVEKELSLPSIDGIDLAGSFDVVLVQGNEQRITAIGHQNIIDELRTSVKDGIWKIDLKNGCFNNFSLRIEITLPEISKLGLSGSGNLVTSGFDNVENLVVILDGSGNLSSNGQFRVSDLAKIESDGSGKIDLAIVSNQLEVKLNGSGDVKLAGLTNNAVIRLNGSQNLKAFNLPIESCNIRSNGSGDAKIQVTSALDAYIGGSGNIRYRGYPDIQYQIDGSGDLINDN